MRAFRWIVAAAVVAGAFFGAAQLWPKPVEASSFPPGLIESYLALGPSGGGLVGGGNCSSSTASCSVLSLTSAGAISGTTGAFSGAVGFADGSVTAPSIAFTSDVDGTGTGFYRSAANSIAFTTNGTQRWTMGVTNFTRVAGDLSVGGGELSTTNALNLSGSAAIYNDVAGEAIVLSDVDGIELRVRTPLGTCGDGSSTTTVPPGTVSMIAGTAAVPTRFCVCRLTPTGSVYAWDNLFTTTANAARSTTNCSD